MSTLENTPATSLSIRIEEGANEMTVSARCVNMPVSAEELMALPPERRSVATIYMLVVALVNAAVDDPEHFLKALDGYKAKRPVKDNDDESAPPFLDVLGSASNNPKVH